jgi:phage replication O-like protein O
MTVVAYRKGMKFTAIPNEILDVLLPHLKPSELKVLLVIIRKTYGWHKRKDWISINQFVSMTGLSSKSVSSSLQTLEEQHVVLPTDAKGSRVTAINQTPNKLYFEYNERVFCDYGYQGKTFSTPGKNFPTTKENTTKQTHTKETPRTESHAHISEFLKNEDDTSVF